MSHEDHTQTIALLTKASKSYPVPGSTLPVFLDLSLRMEKGTCLALMGPNACGKSTLLRVLLGIERLDKGEANLQMTNRELLGAVLQDYRTQLLPWASVKTNLLLPLGGNREPDKTPEEVLASAEQCFQLLGYRIALSTPIQQLSGGQQQAVVLARALAFTPRFYLWDEPTSAIDLSRRRALYRMLDTRWRDENASVLFVTHDLDEALMLADRVIVFNTGMEILLDLNIDRPQGVEGWEFSDSTAAQALRAQVRLAMDGTGPKRQSVESYRL
jgi:NitT/TauT family transport system ATP-binding protein